MEKNWIMTGCISRLFSISVSLFLFGTFSCTSPGTHYNTLVTADSLIISRPDSALHILQTIDASRLNTNKEKAYYALLYTQALHKNDYPLGDDSIISIASRYYAKSKDKEKYARSLLYHGAALEENDLRADALEYYKMADDESECCNDYLTRGLASSWIGILYSRKLIENNRDIEYYKKALEYFTKAGHHANANYIMGLLGKHYRVGQKGRDSAYHYINMAIDHARSRGDSSYAHYNMALLASTYYLDGKYDKAKETGLYIIRNRNKNSISQEVYNTLARSMAHLGQIDSACYYSKKVVIENNDSLSYYITMCEIAEKSGDYKNALKYSKLADKISDSVVLEARKMDLYDIETKYDNEKLENTNQQLKLKSEIRLISFITAVSILVALAFYILYITGKKKAVEQEQLLLIERIKSESFTKTKELLEELSRKNHTEIKLNELFDNKMKTIGNLMDLYYRYESPKLFHANFKSTMNMDNLDQGALADLEEIVNLRYNGLIDRMIEKHPKLNKKEINFIALISCGFSFVEITVFFNFQNDRSIYNYMKRLKIKLGIKTDLVQYINDMKNQSLNNLEP